MRDKTALATIKLALSLLPIYLLVSCSETSQKAAPTPNQNAVKSENKEPLDPIEEKKLLDGAEKLLAEGKNGEVIQLLDDFISREKSIVRAYRLRSDAKGRTKDYPGAIEDCSKMLEIEPDNHAALVSRGTYYTYKNTKEDKEKAVADFTTALKLKAHDPQVLGLRGWAEDGLGEREASQLDLEECIKLKPKDENAHAILAGSYNATSDWQKSLAVCNEGIKLFPRSDWMMISRADAEKHLGQYREAIADYKSAYAIAPKTWDWTRAGMEECYDKLLAKTGEKKGHK
jgi:tetratricopeptide (TPR) repeat protein